jgi:hypothetical protein
MLYRDCGNHLLHILKLLLYEVTMFLQRTEQLSVKFLQLSWMAKLQVIAALFNPRDLKTES